ncbi:uncharacterized protein LOC108599434 isoform X2 [Drosophila busckii]|uniref:uncharacterized protein LOC108599434 isoform X2 n=1 Tax=Drosophila busckii TaxID=30019 RepID=UPI00083EE3C9|nr:uncharacterized protein LOC108599434 isoform X2 [Drosophila busckii]
MGFTSVLEHIKDWTVTHVRTLWWGTTPKSSDHDDGSQPKTEHRSFPNLGEDVHQVLQTPEFEHVLNSVSPFLLASLGAWPGYWLYRGFDYHAHRAHVPLPIYIRQAKLVQFAIIAAGIISFLQSQHSEHIESIKNKQL